MKDDSYKKLNIPVPVEALSNGIVINGNKIDETKIIKNPYFNEEYLSKIQAIDLINRISGVLLAEGYRHSKKEHS